MSSATADMAMTAPDMIAFPAPTITGIKPSAGVNTGGTAITISGTGFQPGAAVTVAGVTCTPVVVASGGTSLTCTTGAKAQTCGAVPTVVTNPDTQSAMSNAFSYGSSQFGFGKATNIANNNNASRAAVWGDFNSDGKNDIANLNAANLNSLSVQLGNGDGTFAASKGVDLGAGNTPSALAVGDLDNNGALDLVVLLTPAANPRVLVMLGQKNGTFKAVGGGPVKLTAGTNPTGVAVATSDNKAKPYVVVAGTLNSGTVNAKASIDVLTNDGTGTLGAPVANSFGAKASTGDHIVLSDINNDGKLDALVVNNQAIGSVYALTGDGTGVFTALAASPFLMGVNPNHVVAVDLDGDGNADLATANTGGNGVGVGLSIRKGDGMGGFGNAPTAITLVNVPTNITTADFNMDGIRDIAVSHNMAAVGGNSFSYLLGKGALTYQPVAIVAVNVGSDSIIAAPFNINNDGNDDVVTSSTSVNLSIVLNQCQ